MSMSETVMIGQGHEITELPLEVWEAGVSEHAEHIRDSLGFMSEDHHRVRCFAVRELLNVGAPLSPKFISRELNLPVGRVNTVLDELERNKTFLFRNERGEVTWAYPATVDQTPHRIALSTGQQGYTA
jgi:hypothetical protein